MFFCCKTSYEVDLGRQKGAVKMKWNSYHIFNKEIIYYYQILEIVFFPFFL